MSQRFIKCLPSTREKLPKYKILKSIRVIIAHSLRLSAHKGRMTPKLLSHRISRVLAEKDCMELPKPVVESQWE